MRLFLTAVMVTLSCISTLQADIVFRSEGPASPITLGDTATFNVFVSSDAGAADVNYLEMRANFGDGTGTGGSFTSASQVFLLVGNGDDTFDPFDVGLPGSAYNINQGPTVSVDSEMLYASLVLDTTGAQVGNYGFSLDNLFAFFNAPTTVEYPTRAANGVSYRIEAVPEPNSFALASLLGLSTLAVRRRR